MAAAKPRIHISLFLKMLADADGADGTFNKSDVNHGRAFNEFCVNHTHLEQKSEIQDGNCQTGNTFISAYRQDGNENSSAVPIWVLAN